MNNAKRSERYYELYTIMANLGFNKTQIANYFNCSRNTLNKIINKEMIDSIERIDKLFDIKDNLTRDFFIQLDGFNKLNERYKNYVFSKPNSSFVGLNDSFSYALDYIDKSILENKNEDIEKIIKYIQLHMYNFHMRLNPYYYIMRGYFNKEIRPIIDFNIDYEKNEIIDFNIKTLRTAKHNDYAIDKEYNLDYENQFNKIAKNAANLTDRQIREMEKYDIKFDDNLNIKKMKFNDFVDLLYIFCIGYSDSYNIRFMIYEEGLVNKFTYIKSKLKDNTHKKLIDELKTYNLARLFNIKDKYLPVEYILLNYKFDKLNNMNKESYVAKIYGDVSFRISEIENLIIMVAGLECEQTNELDSIIMNYDDEDGLNNNSGEWRRREIQNKQKEYIGKI